MYNGPYLLAGGFIRLFTQARSLGDPGTPGKTLHFDSQVLREQYLPKKLHERRGTKPMDEQSLPVDELLTLGGYVVCKLLDVDHLGCFQIWGLILQVRWRERTSISAFGWPDSYPLNGSKALDSLRLLSFEKITFAYTSYCFSEHYLSRAVYLPARAATCSIHSGIDRVCLYVDLY